MLLLLTGTLSGLSYSIYSAISKSVLKNRFADPFLFLLWVNLFQAGLTLLLWLVVTPVFPERAGWLPLLAAGVTCVIGYLFLYLALSCGDVSSVMPIMGSKVIFSGVLARLFLQEHHSPRIYLSILLVALSIGALSYSPSRGKRPSFHLKPILLMLGSCVIFSVTDIFIKQSLAFLDSYNFIVYYNLIVGVASLLIIPYLRSKRVSLRIERGERIAILASVVFLVVASVLFVTAFRIADGVVIPNILMASRGVFIVLISLVMTRRGSLLLDEQSNAVYALRLAASLLIVFSIVLALKP